MNINDINNDLNTISNIILSEKKEPDLRLYVAKFADVSKQLGFEYFSFRVPVYVRVLQRSEIYLASYIDWSGDEVEKPILIEGLYPNHTAFSFDKQERLWIVPPEQDSFLNNCGAGEYLNTWKEGVSHNIEDLPKYGSVAHENTKKQMKTSVVLPMGNYSIIGGNVDLGHKNQNLGVAVFESPQYMNKPDENLKKTLLHFSFVLLKLYLKHFEIGFSNLNEEVFLNHDS